MFSARWLDRSGGTLLRWSLAVIFLWFGLLKLADLCPLAGFICRTMPLLPPSCFLVLLGCWEAAIGVCLFRARWTRLGLLLLFLDLPGTALPLVLLPDECFTRFPYALTLEGQYIVKNLILASAALVVFTREMARRLAYMSVRDSAANESRVAGAESSKPRRSASALNVHRGVEDSAPATQT